MPKSKPVEPYKELTEEDLELIQWRATRGSHYAGTYIQGSKYAQQVVEEDVPRLLMEIHLLKKQIDASGVEELDEGRLRKTAKDLLDYYDRYGEKEFNRRFGTKDVSGTYFVEFLRGFLRTGEAAKPSE